MPAPVSTCLLVAAACASGASVGVALALCGAALLFECLLAFAR
jgi:hypothetical protein